MAFNQFLIVSAIIADPPGAVDRYIQNIKQYSSDALGFLGHMIVDHPNEFITAVSTIVIAAFTALLAVRTSGLFRETAGLRAAADQQAKDMKESLTAAKKAADAADLSATAALRVEQPIISMLEPELMSITGPVPKDRAYACGGLHGLPYENCVIPQLAFRNRGRTHAFLSSVHLGYMIAKDRPPRPGQFKTVHFRDGTIISIDTKFNMSIDFDLGLTDPQREELRNGAILWVWCLLTYDDFMDLRLGKEFWWQWSHYPEDAGRDDAYHFMALNGRDKIDPELLRDDYESAAE